MPCSLVFTEDGSLGTPGSHRDLKMVKSTHVMVLYLHIMSTAAMSTAMTRYWLGNEDKKTAGRVRDCVSNQQLLRAANEEGVDEKGQRAT